MNKEFPEKIHVFKDDTKICVIRNQDLSFLRNGTEIATYKLEGTQTLKVNYELTPEKK